MSSNDDAPGLPPKAIFYATDFSVYAQNPGLYAALLAKHFSTRLIVAHAFTLSQAAMEVEVEDSLVSQQRKDLEALLEHKCSALASGVAEVVPLLLEGDPVEVLPAAAEKYKPSLLVLGSHGGGRVGRALVGSVAERVLRSTEGPVMTVGPRVRAATAKTLPFRRILYATDLTPAAARAAAFAVCFAREFQAEIDVLNVIGRHGVEHPEKLGEIRKRFYNALDAVIPEQAQKFVHPRTFVEVGNAHEQILKHIRERSIDLLVLGIRKSSHLGMVRRTSRAFQLIVDAECPVLTITG